MKGLYTISIAALIIASVALIMSFQKPEIDYQAEIDKAVDSALKEREEQIVEQYKPRFKEMFEEMDAVDSSSWNPQTLAELFEPLTRMLTDVSDD